MNIPNKALKILDLTKSFSQGYQTIKVLDALTYTFEPGRSYAITGASGTGKSTLLHLLAGLEKPTKGGVYLDGEDIFSMNQGDLRSHIGIVFQVPHLIDELTLVENVMVKGLIDGQGYHNAATRALFLLERVGLAGKAQQWPRSLSGGEQQRVAVARALFGEPAFILADEPTAHLDAATGQELLNLLLEGKQGLIIASHDTSVSERLEVSLELFQGNFLQMNPGGVQPISYRVRHG